MRKEHVKILKSRIRRSLGESHNGCELLKLNSKDMNLLIKNGTSTKIIISASGLVSTSELNKKYDEKKKLVKYLLYIMKNN